MKDFKQPTKEQMVITATEVLNNKGRCMTSNDGMEKCKTCPATMYNKEDCQCADTAEKILENITKWLKTNNKSKAVKGSTAMEHAFIAHSPTVCKECHGIGRCKTFGIPCAHCGGTGKQYQYEKVQREANKFSGEPIPQGYLPCHNCNGKGKGKGLYYGLDRTCLFCNGKGYIKATTKVQDTNGTATIKGTDVHQGIPKGRGAGNKYHRIIENITGQQLADIDVYSVLQAFNVTSAPIQHAVKKLLCAGLRGKGGTVQDLEECIPALERAITMAKGNK